MKHLYNENRSAVATAFLYGKSTSFIESSEFYVNIDIVSRLGKGTK
jgi:hypothetical protein